MMKYFTMNEMYFSEYARVHRIDNVPPAFVRTNLQRLVENVLDPAREWLGYPIYVTSGYRSEAVNRAVGGVENSQHKEGKAADITTRNPKLNKMLFEYIREELDYDQLIWERNGTWIHVSYNNRKDVIV